MGEYASISNLELVMERGFEELTGLGSLYTVLLYIVTLEIIGEKVTNRILIAATIINSAVTFSLKQLFATPRPEGGEHFLTAAFPSGHAATAFTVAAVLGWRYPKLRIWLLVVASMVATGRVIMSAHFVADVVVGGAIGYIIGTLTAWKMEKMIEQGKMFQGLEK